MQAEAVTRRKSAGSARASGHPSTQATATLDATETAAAGQDMKPGSEQLDLTSLKVSHHDHTVMNPQVPAPAVRK